MVVQASDLYNKEVICVKDGSKLGVMSDVTIDTNSGCIESVIIYGRPRLFGLLGREEDTVISWKCIEVLGDDTVLVSCDPPRTRHRNTKKLFNHFFD